MRSNANTAGRGDIGIYCDIHDRNYRLKKKPDTYWNHALVLLVVIVLCGCVDFFNFKGLFDSFLFDKPFARYAGILAFLIAFDIVPVWAGIDIKKKVQGYRVEMTSIILKIGAFVLGIVCNTLLRIVFMDKVLPSSVYSDGYTEAAAAVDDHRAAFIYALFCAAIPVITSLASGTISYSMSNPRYKEVLVLTEMLDQTREALEQMRALLAEYQADEHFYERLMKKNKELADVEIKTNEAKGMELKDLARFRMAESEGDPTATNILTKPHNDTTVSTKGREE